MNSILQTVVIFEFLRLFQRKHLYNKVRTEYAYDRNRHAAPVEYCCSAPSSPVFAPLFQSDP